jgi:hypothetical protein
LKQVSISARLFVGLARSRFVGGLPSLRPHTYWPLFRHLFSCTTCFESSPFLGDPGGGDGDEGEGIHTYIHSLKS